MNISRNLLLIFFISFFSFGAHADEWVHDVKVLQLSAYQHSVGHFVWLSQQPTECQYALNFSENSPGGKSLLSILMTALASQANVSVWVSGCDINEVYLKSS